MRNWPWRAPGLVALCAILVHGRAIGFDFVGLDDRDLIVDDQPFLTRPVNLLRIFLRSYMHVVDARHAYYRPVVTASYILDAQWSGDHPFGYHATNVALHALASVLFLAVLRRFALGLAATLGALAFAVHPALVGDVAWIPGRNDSLLAVFLLSAWLLLPIDGLHPSLPRRLAHWAFFGLSLMTKETAIAAPLVWALHLVLFAPSVRDPRTWSHLAVVATGWVIAAALRLWLSPARAPLSFAVIAEGTRDLLRILVASAGALVFPVNPSLLGTRDDMPLAAGIVAIGVIGAAAWFVPGVRRRVVALGAAAFALCLVPTLAGGTTIALSSRLYVPACGALLAASAIVQALAATRDGHMVASWCAGVLFVFALLTIAYEGTFRDPRAFARYEVEAAPHSAMAHLCLAATYPIGAGTDRALAEYHLALSLGAVEVVHNNIAVIDMAHGNWGDAESELRQELLVDPRYARAYRNLAIVLRREGHLVEARAAAEKANALEAEGEGP